MRILQVAHGFPPQQCGGTEQYTAQLSQALSQRGHVVAVFTRGADWRLPEYHVQEEQAGSVRIVRLNHTWRHCQSFEESYHHEAVARAFGVLVDRFRPDVVHLQHLVHLSTHLPDEAKRRGIPVVMTMHDYWWICNQGQLLRQDGSLCPETTDCTDCASLWLAMDTRVRRALTVIERWWPDIRYRTSALRTLARRWLRWMPRPRNQQSVMTQRMQQRRQELLRASHQIDVMLVPSRTLREFLAARGLPSEQLRYVPYGLDTAPFAAVRQEPARVLRVAYLGRVIPAKGVGVLLDAADHLERSGIQISIYGDVPPYGDVDQYAARMRRRALRQPAVRWHGSYLHEALPGILAQTDVVVVPSVWYENEPLVILEAFAARIPVVATDLGGMRELVHDGVNGLLFARQDGAGLARCLRRLATEPGLRERLAQGITTVKDIAAHAREIETCYEQLLASSAERAKGDGAAEQAAAAKPDAREAATRSPAGAAVDPTDTELVPDHQKERLSW